MINSKYFFSSLMRNTILLVIFSIVYTTNPEWSISEYGNKSTYLKRPTPQSRKFKLNGEYGLWVQEKDNQIIVHWITQESDSGYLRVYKSDILLYEALTPRASSHRIAIEKNNSNQLVLHYGSLKNEDDQHQTKIYLETSKHNQKATFKNVDSILVIGDVHGEYDNLIELLSNAQVIDENLQWKASRHHLLILGDIFDRGYDVTKTLWFLYKLEKQAAEEGGYVHILLGNHEIMTFVNDLRYLSGKENLVANLHKTEYADMYNVHNSILGKWLASKPGIIKINDILLTHGGVTTDFINYSVEAFNDSLYAYLHEDLFNYLLGDSLSTAKFDSLKFLRRLYFFFSENSVFWHRGYLQADTLKKELSKVLKKFKCKLHVVAHTPVETIQQSYDGKIIAVDLFKPVTEMLLLVRTKSKKYKKFKYKINGSLEPL